MQMAAHVKRMLATRAMPTDTHDNTYDQPGVSRVADRSHSGHVW
jgi:hypothetical protein